MATTRTYADYLRLPELLSLQHGFEANDSEVSEDERHFIVVHQVFELWFKLVIGELRMVRDRMGAQFVPDKDIPFVVRHLRRVNAVLKIAVNYFDALETLTPLDFIAFRNKLEPTSGAQSYQMRVIELLMGLDQAERQRHGHSLDPANELLRGSKGSPSEPSIVQAIESAREELKAGKSVRASLHEWLYRTPIQDSCPTDANDESNVAAFLQEYRLAVEKYDKRLVEPFVSYIGDAKVDRRDWRIRAALLFIESYREAGFLTWPNLLLDSVVEMEEEFILWRVRHVRMVERTIGRRLGTGGSPGVAYLDRTTEYRIFNEFWAVRSVLIPSQFLPPLKNPERYDRLENVPRA